MIDHETKEIPQQYPTINVLFNAYLRSISACNMSISCFNLSLSSDSSAVPLFDIFRCKIQIYKQWLGNVNTGQLASWSVILFTSICFNALVSWDIYIMHSV